MIVGVDVGFDGAIAWEDSYGRVNVIDMPTLLDPNRKKKTSKARILWEGELYGLFEDLKDMSNNDLVVWIERQTFFPKQANASSRKMHQFGFIKGVLLGLQIPYETVHPRTWQTKLQFPKGCDTKAQSILRASRLFSDVSLIPEGGSKKPKDGRADALNIMDYGRKVEND